MKRYSDPMSKVSSPCIPVAKADVASPETAGLQVPGLESRAAAGRERRMPAMWGRLRGTAAVLAAAAILLLGGTAVRAQEEPAEQPAGENLEMARQARQLSDEIMSPFCPGRTLAECPSPDAAVQRERVRAWLETGLSEADIKARLDREFAALMQTRGFSPTLSAVPKGAAGWVAPILLLCAGAAILVTVLLRLQRKPTLPDAPSADRLRQAEAELEAEMAARGLGGAEGRIGGRPPRA